jgi:hypothetical protein
MALRKSLEDLTSQEMRDRALDYRMMAEMAKSDETKDAFLRVAELLEARAAELD